MDMKRVELPLHLPIWPNIRKKLTELKETCIKKSSTLDDITALLNSLSELTGANELPTWNKRFSRTSRSKESNSLLWYGFGKFIKKTDKREQDKVLHSLLPAIMQLALDIESLPSTIIKFSVQQQESTTTLSRSMIASVLACGFLCLYPPRQQSKPSKLNEINFVSLLRNLPLPTQVAKLRCIFNYFDKVTNNESDKIGTVSYTRKCLSESRVPVMEDYLTSDQELCPLIVHNDGCLEDMGSDAMEVDFANKFIGGGTLGKGAVQEEIRFVACPELIASQLFMECMEDNESIIISGYKQHSLHSGYASTFTYDGPYHSQDEGENIMCCMDATTFRNKPKKTQYTEKYILRETNKALIGFTGQSLFNSHADDHNNLNIKESSDDEFHTALESSDDDHSPRIISEFASQMLKGLLSQATREIVEKNRRHKKAKRVTSTELMVAAGNVVRNPVISETPPNVPSVLSDGQIIVGSTEQLNQQNNYLSANIYDGINTEFGDWLSNFRRRSSNLSEINSRRSSSSTKHSSDISSDLDELYESYIKSEKAKHGTIHEESFETISDFATKLISCLMQEGTSKAATMMPGNQNFDESPPTPSGIQNFDKSPPPSASAVKPHPVKEPAEKHTKDISNAAELLAEKLLKSVLTHAMLEATSIIGIRKAASDSSHPEHSNPETAAKIPDSTYVWFADRIVQDAFVQASEEFGRPEIHVDNVLNIVEPNINNKESFSSGDSYPPCLSLNFVPDENSSYDSFLSSSLGSDKMTSPDQRYLPERTRNYSLNTEHGDELHCFLDIQMLEKSDSNSDHSVSVEKDQEPVSSVSLNINDAAAVIVQKVIKNIPKCLENEFADTTNLVRTPSDHCVKFDNSILEQENNKCRDQTHTVTFAEDKSVPLLWSNFSKREDKYKKNDTSNAGAGILTKKLSRETVTNAYLKVENRRHAKSYERRSSEPCHISVERSLQAYDNEKTATNMDKKSRKISRTDEDFDRFKADSKRRGSWDVMPNSRRRSSCGFKDPVLSRFAEELMKADMTIPPLHIAQKPESSTTGSRRSSISAFKDQILANFDMELLGSSFEAPSSPRHSSVRRHSSRESRMVRSDSSDTEYMWFPPPRRVGVEFQEDFERLQTYRSVDEIEDFADMIAQNVLEEAVIILNREQEENLEEDSIREIELFAEEISLSVIDSAFAILKRHAKNLLVLSKCPQTVDSNCDFQNDSCDDFHDALDVNFHAVEHYADKMAASMIESVMKKLFRKEHKLDEFRRDDSRCISTGNWGCGAFRGDPHLKSLLQWIAASIVNTPFLHYYIFGDPRLVRFEEVVEFIRNKNWNVGDVIKVIQQYCQLLQDDSDFIDEDSILPITLFDYILTF